VIVVNPEYISRLLWIRTTFSSLTKDF